MREFFKYVLATIVGILSLFIFMFLMSMMTLLAVAISGNQKAPLENNSVLRLQLTGTIVEQAEDNPLAFLLGNDALEEQGLDEIVKAIKAAKDNSKVKGIYIEAGALSADFASLEELRKALADFKESGKFVLAYADTYTQGAYYVASLADKVLINPEGMLDWHGVAAQPTFYKELLEKLGVRMQIFRVGTYKSAVEPYMLTEMSPANRQMTQAMIDDVWGNIVAAVAEARGITPDSLNAYADRYQGLVPAEEYVSEKLVDKLAYLDDVRSELRQLVGDKEPALISTADLAKYYEGSKGSDKVAVYYAAGEIVDEVADFGPLNGTQIVGRQTVEDLDELANDDDVKAVVLRVNSPGGSAYASEQIWHAVQKLKEKKPVVVSMSGYAASGGYYISCGADCIIANPTTLTGSIGIFGMVPDLSGLLEGKLGLHFDVAKTNRLSDFSGNTGKLSAESSELMQAHVNRGYKLFLSRVADGRGLTCEQVDSIAQGRVWTGQQAIALKLVDKLGTLDDAIAEAASRAKLKKYAVTTSERESSLFKSLMDEAKDDYMERRLKEVLGIYYSPLRTTQQFQGRNALQARMFFEPNLK